MRLPNGILSNSSQVVAVLLKILLQVMWSLI